MAGVALSLTPPGKDRERRPLGPWRLEDKDMKLAGSLRRCLTSAAI